MAHPVTVTGYGVVDGDAVTLAADTEARCDLCGHATPSTVTLADNVAACASCLRAGLETLSVGRWRLKTAADGGTLPWGKLTS